MTPEDLTPSLSLIADRYLERAKKELEELGIDTAGMLPAEIFDQLRNARLNGGPAQGGNAPEEPRQLRRSRERIEIRGHRAWRHDWRRKSGLRQRIGKRIPRQD
jgi:hypothetical protein